MGQAPTKPIHFTRRDFRLLRMYEGAPTLKMLIDAISADIPTAPDHWKPIIRALLDKVKQIDTSTFRELSRKIQDSMEDARLNPDDPDEDN